MDHPATHPQSWIVVRWYRSLLMACVIAAGLIFGISWLIVQARFVADSKQADGKIIRIETSSARGGLTYHPIFRFHDQNDQEVISRNVIFADRDSFKVGEPVDVLYDPDRPRINALNRFRELWAFPLSITTLSAGMTAIWIWAGNKRRC